MPIFELAANDRERACALLTRLYDSRNQIHGKGVRIPKTFPKDELAWLESVGLAPNQRTTLHHAKVVQRIVDAKHDVSIADGARAFIASLGEGPPHGVLLEVALLAHRMPAHRLRGNGGTCHVCMMDTTVTVDVAEQFHDWHTSGSGIPGDPTWAVLGLDQLRAHPVRRVSAEAKARMGAILHTLDNLPDEAPMGTAIEAIQTLDVLGDDPKGSRARGVLETLAFAGMLEAPPYRGIAAGWIDFIERDRRPNKYVEVEAPLSYWRGRDGVCWEHARAILGIDRRAAATAEPPRAVRPAKKATPKPANRPPAGPRSPRRPAKAGDVWAIRVREDTYVLVYVWHPGTGARPYARVEYLDWIGPTPPAADEVTSLGVRPRGKERWQMLAHSLHKTTGTALIATDISPPKRTGPEPDRTPGGAAKELAWLADACFPELAEL